MSVRLGLGLSALGGLGLVAALPPVGAWPLIFVSFVPIAYAQHRVLPVAWAGLAPAIGIGGYISYAAWGALLPNQRFWLVPIVALLWFAGRFDRRWQEATRFRHFWWSSPVMWTGGLFAVGLSPISSWLDPAYALYRQPWLIQPVSVFAMSGLNLVILLTNYAIAGVFLFPRSRTRLATVAAVALVFAAWIGTSIALLDAGRSGATVRVAVVQPGQSDLTPATTRSAAAARNASILHRLEAGTREAAAAGAQLVVWPEEALQFFDPTVDNTLELRRLVVATGTYVVVGYTPDPHRLNQATILDPTGLFLSVYNKRHPLAFQGDHSIGGPIVVVDTELGRIAPIICYDLDFENTARTTAQHGAQLLAVPSHDWSAIAHQHYARLVFRAVENRVAAVKADTAWDSAIIDPQGRILDSHVSTSASSVVLVKTVALGTGHSPFVTTGNWVGWTCVGLSILWLGIAIRATATSSRGRSRRGSPRWTR